MERVSLGKKLKMCLFVLVLLGICGFGLVLVEAETGIYASLLGSAGSVGMVATLLIPAGLLETFFMARVRPVRPVPARADAQKEVEAEVQ